MLASILTSLPWASLKRERSSRGKFFGQAGPRAGAAQNRPKNWRERIQIKKGETPWLASAGTTVPAGAPLSFRFQVVPVPHTYVPRRDKRPTFRGLSVALGRA